MWFFRRLLIKPELETICFRIMFRPIYNRHSQCHRGVALDLKPSANTDFYKVETILDVKKHQQVIDFINDNSYPRSSERMPLAIGHGALTSLIEQIPEFLHQGVSLVATDPARQDDQVIGVAINHVLIPSDSFDRASPYAGVKGFRACLQHVQDKNNIFETKKMKRGMNVFYLGVKECFEGRGLARNLAENSIQLARQLKMDFVQSIAFSEQTCNIFRGLEFEKLKSSELFHYQIDGAQAFPNARTDDVVHFLFKNLTNN